MSKAKQQRLLSCLEEYKSHIKSISFAPLHGEPMISKDLVDMIKNMKQILPTIEYIILTNGSCLDNEYLEQLHDITLCVSVLGSKYPPYSYQEITSNTWDSILHKVTLAYNFERSYNHNIKLIVLLMLYNYNNILQNIIDLTSMKDLIILVGKLYTEANSLELEPITELDRVLEDVEFIRKHYNINIYIYNLLGRYNTLLQTNFNLSRYFMPIQNPITTYCRALDDNIFINVNGDVIACCCSVHEDTILGSILSETLEEIMNKRHTQLLREWLHKNIPISSDCVSSCYYRFSKESQIYYQKLHGDNN